MRTVIQRVNSASVTIRQNQIAQISKGLLIFLGIEKDDGTAQAKYLAEKIIQLRLFADQNQKMNLNAKEVNAQLLVVSQFTLCAKVGKGRRPSFDRAAPPAIAESLYHQFIQYLSNSQLKIEQGIFREYMRVAIENDGPVTFILDTRKE